MNYLGTDPREGAVLVASSDVTSNTGSITLTGIFESETMYFINIMDFRPNNDQRSLQYRWLDGSDNAISITNYHEGGRYGYSGGAGSTGGVYAADRTDGYAYILNGGGNAGDEAGHAEMWCVPNTTQEKMAYHSGHYHTGTDEDYFTEFGTGTRLNTSATVAEGIEFRASAFNINNISIRVYKLGTKVNPLRSLKRRHTDNWVDSNYIGGAVKGQGWAKIAQATAADGDSAIQFNDCFTDNYKRYVITATDCRPSTNDQHLLTQWVDGTAPETSTYYSTTFHADHSGSTATGISDDETHGLVMGNVGTDASEAGHAIMWCTPRSTNTPKFLNYRSIQHMGSAIRYVNGSNAYNDATAFTGIKFYFASGNMESGTIKIYGVND